MKTLQCGKSMVSWGIHVLVVVVLGQGYSFSSFVNVLTQRSNATETNSLLFSLSRFSLNDHADSKLDCFLFFLSRLTRKEDDLSKLLALRSALPRVPRYTKMRCSSLTRSRCPFLCVVAHESHPVLNHTSRRTLRDLPRPLASYSS